MNKLLEEVEREIQSALETVICKSNKTEMGSSATYWNSPLPRMKRNV